jgi:hypothetical protein
MHQMSRPGGAGGSGDPRPAVGKVDGNEHGDR